MEITFLKGHGTGNDFVVVPDPEGALEIGPELVAAICDRHRGIGADGLLRVVRTAHAPEVADRADAAEWFMDYRNADGSLAEMCGNGVRVYTRYLLASGLAAGPSVAILTRAGVVVADDRLDEISATMPTPQVGDQSAVTVGAASFTGTVVSVGNPHLVCWVDDPATLDLAHPPVIDPAVFPHGANVEFIARLAPAHLRMRVIERGVGETLSCGSGAIAAAAVARRAGDGDTIVVEVPGGTLRVGFGESTTLAGPAVLIAIGTLSL